MKGQTKESTHATDKGVQGEYTCRRLECGYDCGVSEAGRTQKSAGRGTAKRGHKSSQICGLRMSISCSLQTEDDLSAEHFSFEIPYNCTLMLMS